MQPPNFAQTSHNFAQTSHNCPQDYWKNRRDHIERAKWAAAGLEYIKGKSLQRELMKAQSAEMKQHIDASSSNVMRHIDASIDASSSHILRMIEPMRSMLVGTDGESTTQTKARLQLQLQAVCCMERHDREAKKRRRDS